MSLASVYQKLKPPPVIKGHIHKICMTTTHFQNGNVVFIATSMSNQIDTAGIWMYDLDQQMVIEKYPYSCDLLCTNHIVSNCCIDSTNRIIYVHHNHHIESFNLDTKQWNTTYVETSDGYGRLNCMSKMFFVTEPIQELHILSSGTHYRIDKQNKSLISLSKISSHFVGVVYLSSKKQLFLFQQYVKNIMFCNINGKQQCSLVWNKYPIKIPDGLGKLVFGLIACDQIVVLFFHNMSGLNIWCLDLINNDKWYQSAHSLSNKKFDKIFWDHTAPHRFIFTDCQDIVHVMKFGPNCNFHFKASALDIISSEIVVLNRNKYNLLVFGYIKKCNISFIPVQLKKLVFAFCSIFGHATF
eukprot:284742_1